jgi:hypothetical protein
MTESGEDWPWYLVTIPHEHVETVHDERRKLLMSLEPGEHASWDYGITTDGTTRVMEWQLDWSFQPGVDFGSPEAVIEWLKTIEGILFEVCEDFPSSVDD